MSQGAAKGGLLTGILFLVLSAVLFYIAKNDFDVVAHSRSQPTLVTADRLIAYGPGDNHYIRLTDYKVAKAKWVTGQGVDYLKGELVPASGTRSGKVIKVSDYLLTQSEFNNFIHSTTVDGFVSPDDGWTTVTAKKRPEMGGIFSWVAIGAICLVVGASFLMRKPSAEEAQAPRPNDRYSKPLGRRRF
ncbi:MAG: hypothetical protein C5B53_00275 [Candidatus Melainabacteria bacterium]|nr:MAG: hypothetical protein C5B53_00275 [Candidatus Melainabacteria bacterium]